MQSITSAKYFSTVGDDYTKATWIFMMQQKSLCPNYITKFLSMVVNSIWNEC